MSGSGLFGSGIRRWRGCTDHWLREPRKSLVTTGSWARKTDLSGIPSGFAGKVGGNSFRRPVGEHVFDVAGTSTWEWEASEYLSYLNQPGRGGDGDPQNLYIYRGISSPVFVGSMGPSFLHGMPRCITRCRPVFEAFRCGILCLVVCLTVSAGKLVTC